MAEGRSYGDLLREARERQGMDLVTIARALHIRPDIVRAIESADFRKMPAHGYTKNMVRAYARRVGLDEDKIGNLYLSERERFEDGGTQGQRRSSRETHTHDAPSRPLPHHEGTTRRGVETDRFTTRTSTQRRSSSRQPARARDTASQQTRNQRIANLLPSFGSNSKRDPRVGHSFMQADMASGLGSGQGTGRQGRAIGLAGLNLSAVLGVAAAAVILIVIAVVLFNGNRQSVDDVPDIPISGLTDTSSTSTDEATPAVSAPTSALFSFSVADGAQAWIEVYMDGNKTPVYAAIAEGPLSQDFEVTGTLTFETANISPVTLTLDGQPVQATPSTKGTNYVYTVDFPSILAAWKKDHDIKEEGGEDGASSSSSSSSQQDSSDASSSTGSSKSAGSSAA